MEEATTRPVVLLEVSAAREREVRATVCSAIEVDFGHEVDVEVLVDARAGSFGEEAEAQYIYASVAPHRTGDYARLLTFTDGSKDELSMYDEHPEGPLVGMYARLLKVTKPRCCTCIPPRASMYSRARTHTQPRTCSSTPHPPPPPTPFTQHTLARSSLVSPSRFSRAV